LLAIVAEPYAVARCLEDEQVLQGGALFIDVGGGTTDVALVRQGGVEGTRMFALGGRAFTKSLADRLELPFPRAEAIKVDFAKGVDVERIDEVRQIVEEDVAVWTAGVELVLEEFGKEGLLPGRIYLCGGGARLPQISAALKRPEFARGLPFGRPVQVQPITPGEVARINDATELLVDEQDVPPLGLAHQALEMSAAEAPLDAALRRVLRAMKV
jgi:cell division protein FtsA